MEAKETTVRMKSDGRRFRLRADVKGNYDYANEARDLGELLAQFEVENAVAVKPLIGPDEIGDGHKFETLLIVVVNQKLAGIIETATPEGYAWWVRDESFDLFKLMQLVTVSDRLRGL